MGGRSSRACRVGAWRLVAGFGFGFVDVVVFVVVVVDSVVLAAFVVFVAAAAPLLALSLGFAAVVLLRLLPRAGDRTCVSILDASDGDGVL